MANVLNKDPFTYAEDRRSFLEDLKRFHIARGTPFDRIPQIAGTEIDLYRLYRRVIDLGGWQKVNNDLLWEDIQEEFKVPLACTNGSQALKHVYFRYLNIYEKVNFLGFCADDCGNNQEDGPSRKKVYLPMESIPFTYNYSQHKVDDNQRAASNLSTNLVRFSDYEKLEMSLRSGLPNEVDFAVNVCLLMSSEGQHVLKLNKSLHLVSLLLANIGIFEEGIGTMEDVMVHSWSVGESKRDYQRFWHDVVKDEQIREMVATKNGICRRESREGNEVLHLGRDLSLRDTEGQRVTQMAVLIRNLSFETFNQQPLASSNLVFRFLMLCVYSSYGDLRQLALDTLGNLAVQMTLQPMETTPTKLFMNLIKKSLTDKDKFVIVRALEILGKLCQLEKNEAILNEALEPENYTSIVRLLLIHDIQLIVHTLEALYQLSELGDPTTTKISNVTNVVGVLVNLISVEAQSFGPDSLNGIKVMEFVPAQDPNAVNSSSAQLRHTVIQPLAPSQVLGTVVQAAQKVVNADQNKADVETTACNWLKGMFEVKKNSHVSQTELFAEYQQFCSKFGIADLLNAADFANVVKIAYSQTSVGELDKGGGDKELVFKGLSRRPTPKPFAIQAGSDRVLKPSRCSVPVNSQRGSGPANWIFNDPMLAPLPTQSPTLRQRLMEPPRMSVQHQLLPPTGATSSGTPPVDGQVTKTQPTLAPKPPAGMGKKRQTAPTPPPTQPSGPGPGAVSPRPPGPVPVSTRPAIMANILQPQRPVLALQQQLQAVGTSQVAANGFQTADKSAGLRPALLPTNLTNASTVVSNMSAMAPCSSAVSAPSFASAVSPGQQFPLIHQALQSDGNVAAGKAGEHSNDTNLIKSLLAKKVCQNMVRQGNNTPSPSPPPPESCPDSPSSSISEPTSQQQPLSTNEEEEPAQSHQLSEQQQSQPPVVLQQNHLHQQQSGLVQLMQKKQQAIFQAATSLQLQQQQVAQSQVQQHIVQQTRFVQQAPLVQNQVLIQQQQQQQAVRVHVERTPQISTPQVAVHGKVHLLQQEQSTQSNIVQHPQTPLQHCAAPSQQQADQPQQHMQHQAIQQHIASHPQTVQQQHSSQLQAIQQQIASQQQVVQQQLAPQQQVVQQQLASQQQAVQQQLASQQQAVQQQLASQQQVVQQQLASQQQIVQQQLATQQLAPQQQAVQQQLAPQQIVQQQLASQQQAFQQQKASQQQAIQQQLAPQQQIVQQQLAPQQLAIQQQLASQQQAVQQQLAPQQQAVQQQLASQQLAPQQQAVQQQLASQQQAVQQQLATQQLAPQQQAVQQQVAPQQQAVQQQVAPQQQAVQQQLASQQQAVQQQLATQQLAPQQQAVQQQVAPQQQAVQQQVAPQQQAVQQLASQQQVVQQQLAPQQQAVQQQLTSQQQVVQQQLASQQQAVQQQLAPQQQIVQQQLASQQLAPQQQAVQQQLASQPQAVQQQLTAEAQGTEHQLSSEPRTSQQHVPSQPQAVQQQVTSQSQAMQQPHNIVQQLTTQTVQQQLACQPQQQQSSDAQGMQHQVVQQSQTVPSPQPNSVQNQLQMQLQHAQVQQQAQQIIQHGQPQLLQAHPHIQQVLHLQGQQVVLHQHPGHQQQQIHIQPRIAGQQQTLQLQPQQIVLHANPHQQPVHIRPQQQIILQQHQQHVVIQGQSGLQQILQQPMQQVQIQPSQQLHIQGQGQPLTIQNPTQHPMVIQLPLYQLPQAGTSQMVTVCGNSIPNAAGGLSQTTIMPYRAILPHSVSAALSSHRPQIAANGQTVIQQAHTNSKQDQGNKVVAVAGEAVASGSAGVSPNPETGDSEERTVAQSVSSVQTTSHVQAFFSQGLSVSRASTAPLSIAMSRNPTAASYSLPYPSSNPSSMSITQAILSGHEVHKAVGNHSHAIWSQAESHLQHPNRDNGHVNGNNVNRPEGSECNGMNEVSKTDFKAQEEDRVNGTTSSPDIAHSETMEVSELKHGHGLNGLAEGNVNRLKELQHSKEWLQAMMEKAGKLNGVVYHCENGDHSEVKIDVDRAQPVGEKPRQDRCEIGVGTDTKLDAWHVNGLSGHAVARDLMASRPNLHQVLVKQTSVEEASLDSTDSKLAVNCGKGDDSAGRPLFSPVSSRDSDVSCDSFASSLTDSVSSDKHSNQGLHHRPSSSAPSPSPSPSSAAIDVPLVLAGTIPASEAANKRNRKRPPPKPTVEKNTKKRKTVDGKNAATDTCGAPKLSSALAMEYMCEWAGCRRCFGSASQVLVHVTKSHVPHIPEFVCQWHGCEPLRRKRWSLVTHLQDHHCTEAALRASCQRRFQAARAGTVQPTTVTQQQAPPIVYPPDAALQAIRRFHIKPPFDEFSEEREGPVTKHIRLTSALILRNLARYSSHGRSLIKQKEQHLISVALNAVESSTAMSNCLWEILNDR